MTTNTSDTPIYVSWAGTADWAEKSQANQNTYKTIVHLKGSEHMTFSKIPKYARTSFKGELLSVEAKALTDAQILLLMDSGNLCFGGTIHRTGDKFHGSYYTD